MNIGINSLFDYVLVVGLKDRKSYSTDELDSDYYINKVTTAIQWQFPADVILNFRVTKKCILLIFKFCRYLSLIVQFQIFASLIRFVDSNTRRMSIYIFYFIFYSIKRKLFAKKILEMKYSNLHLLILTGVELMAIALDW